MSQAATTPTFTAQPAATVVPVAVPQAKAGVDPVLNTQLMSLQTQAAAEAAARILGNQTQWMMPVLQPGGAKTTGWTGDLFDWSGISAAFDRTASNTAFTNATSNPAAPGTTGDLAVTTLQVDYLAIMERAFRMRHTFRRPRIMAHMCGRKYGHGLNTGPLQVSVLNFLAEVVKQSNGGAVADGSAT